MHRITVRSVLCVLAVACGALAAGGSGTALATTVTYDGDTLVVTGGDNAGHDIQFRLVFLGANQTDPRDRIIDAGGFTSIPADCDLGEPTNSIDCPPHVNVRVDLGAGNDDVTFGGSLGDCFNDYVVNLGEGANTARLNDGCPTTPAETATLTGGSGPDQLVGGTQATTFLAGGGDDTVNGGGAGETLHGGDGNDRLYGGGGNDQVLGEGGNDDPDGGAGNDLVDGGAGDDRLEYSQGLGGNDTGAGADAYAGGAGTDRLVLDNHPGGVDISLDGAANDGVPGEGDNVASDIETIEGTGGNDRMSGSAGPDTFYGGGGNDELRGGGGADDLNGGGGDDRLFGEAGNDKLQGSNGSDTVDGGAGSDQLYGDTGSCSVFCSFDADTLLARDGERDAVDCGGGADTAQVDSLDVVAFCASVDRSAVVPPSPPPLPPAPPKPTPVAMPGLSTVGALSIAKGLKVAVTCPSACRFTVSVVLAAKTAKRYRLGARATTVSTGRGTLPAAGSRTTKLKLTAKARRRLKRVKVVKATLRLAVTDGSGKKTVRAEAITLRP